MLTSLRVLLILSGALALAACRPGEVENDAPAPTPAGIPTAALGARGANFDPQPALIAPRPASPPRSPMKSAPLPPDPFGGALPDDGAEPDPPVSGGVHL